MFPIFYVVLGLLGLGLCPKAFSLPLTHAASGQFEGLGDTGSPADGSDDGPSSVAPPPAPSAPSAHAPLPVLPILLASLGALLLLALALLALYLRRRRARARARTQTRKESEPTFRRARMVRSLPGPVFAVPRDVESDGENDVRGMREVAPYPFAHGAGV